MKNYYVYILTNKSNSVLYIGVTNNLEKRVYEHNEKVTESFTEKYNVHKVVYFETTTDVVSAIEREKQLKKWSRKKKEELIQSINPNFNDLLKSS